MHMHPHLHWKPGRYPRSHPRPHPKAAPTTASASASAPTPAPSRVTPWERDQGSYIDRYFDRQNYVPLIQRPSPLPPSHPAGPLARWLAPANSVQPPASDTTTSTTHQRELHGHQPDLQQATPYSRLQTQHDLHPPDRTEMLNRGHAPSETPPLSAATPLTFRPRLLHYINSGLAWFAGTVRRHRHKGWDRLGDAPTTRPLEQPQPPSHHSLPRGGASDPPKPPRRTGEPLGPPMPAPAQSASASVPARARAPAAHCPGPGPTLDGPSSWPVPGDGYPFLPKDTINSSFKGS